MSEEREKYKVRPGQPPLGQRDREKTTYLKFALLQSQFDYLKKRATAEKVSMAELLRRLIAQDMER